MAGSSPPCGFVILFVQGKGVEILPSDTGDDILNMGIPSKSTSTTENGFFLSNEEIPGCLVYIPRQGINYTTQCRDYDKPK